MAKTDENPSVHAAYEQGRTAARGGISKDDAPWHDGTAEHKEWLRGWRFENKQVEATAPIAASETEATGQTATVSASKKG